MREKSSDLHVQAATIGIHIVDILGRPVSAIPSGQGMTLLDEIAMSAAGTAAATAYGLARLGVATATFGVIGNDDLGSWLRNRLQEEGVDVHGLHSASGVPTSATILPIRPDGSRPALHCIGANRLLDEHVIDFDVIKKARHVHIGGSFLLERLDGTPTARILKYAKEHGATTSVDVIGVPDADFERVLGQVYPWIDYFLPNEEDALMLSHSSSLHDAIRWFHGRGVRSTVITLGERGASVSEQGREEAVVPAYAVDVVDTSGCGDAFSAGFISGIIRGKSPVDAALIGTAAGSATAQGLGSSAGVKNEKELEEFMANTPYLGELRA
ncbi:MAG: carbohydrate kinase family protein [Bifidobacterium sp.]|uniref:Carbohydrate kinase family protein n=1 Tax=Bifidobacterium fermentum TaxID=3059035 RepID=A0AB39UP57_9BIFI